MAKFVGAQTPRNGHTWLDALLAFIDWLLALLSWGTGMIPVDVVAATPLPANTYANGTSGVGATLTANSNGAFPTVDGVAPTLGMLVLVAAEAAGANNGLYKLTTLGDSGTAWVLTRFAGYTSLLVSQPAFNSAATIIPGMLFGIRSGTLHGGHTWMYGGSPSPTLGTTALYFASSAKATMSRGVIPSSRLLLGGTKPTAADTFAIGSITFEFVSSLGAAGAHVQVLIGASAATALANAISAINGDAATAGTTWLEATTPFAGEVLADALSTTLRIRGANARGGTPVPSAFASTALTASITTGPSAWTVANLNQQGKAATDAQTGRSNPITVTSAMITAGFVDVDFDFQPTGFIAQVFSSSGVQRAYSDATTMPAGAQSIHIVLGGSATPNIQANDILTVWAWQ